MNDIRFPTLKDVAREAGYSANTVSRYINKKGYIGKEAEKKIQKAIGKLSYYPFISARIMKKVKSNTIALIISSIKNDFYIGVIRGAEEVLRESGYSVMIFDCRWKSEREKESLQLSISYRVDGIIICSSNVCSNKQLISSIIDKNKIPVVMIENHEKDINADFVLFNDEKGAYLLVEHLIKKHNKKRIGIILPSSPVINIESYGRYKGYKRALKDNGINLDKDLIFSGSISKENGYKITKEMVKREDIDAIFTSNTIFGTGAIKAMNEAGVHYPDGIAFVTFDDYDINTVFHPYITSLKRIDREFGEVSARTLIKRIEDNIESNSKSNKIIKIDTELEIRESCGCLLNK
jgi:LacI family transcriptional regulator